MIDRFWLEAHGERPVVRLLLVPRVQDINQELSLFRRSIAMLALIVAGEAVFFLPFVLPRVFRPTLLDVFHLTNLQLGIAFSVYGVVAMLAYFPGGPLADRFSARKLMCFALVATSIGGFALAMIPSLAALKVLYGFWGVTTILLFWAPLIRATRAWGGAKLPGRAFGILDGGRGLVAAAIGSGAVALFSFFMPAEVQNATLDQRADAFRQVIFLFSGITFAAAVFVWFALPRRPNRPTTYRTSSDREEWGVCCECRPSGFKQSSWSVRTLDTRAWTMSRCMRTKSWDSTKFRRPASVHFRCGFDLSRRSLRA